MIRWTERCHVDAPPAVVWAYRLDFRNLSAYNPDVSDLRQIGGTAPGAGSRYEFRVKIGPARMRSTLVVREATEPSAIVVDIASAVAATEVCRFEADGTGTRVVFDTTIHVPGGALGAFLAWPLVVPSGRRQTRRELVLMKRALEHG